MAKYEIMLILDPKEDIQVAEKLVNETFKNAEFKKLDRTELAYEINKSKTATYVLVNTEANGAEVKEFIRRSNIMKTVWRHLVVNLDTEMGREDAIAKMAARAAKQKEYREQRELREKQQSSSQEAN